MRDKIMDLRRVIAICDAHQQDTINTCKTCAIQEYCKKENLKKVYNVKTLSQLKI